jgi:hypothetical protein
MPIQYYIACCSPKPRDTDVHVHPDAVGKQYYPPDFEISKSVEAVSSPGHMLVMEILNREAQAGLALGSLKCY